MADVQMTFTEHLEELRTRLIRAIAALLVCSALGYVFRNQILAVLVLPLAEFQQETPLQVIGLLEPFLAPIRLAVYTGVILAFPFIVYQGLMFTMPALLPRERRVILGSLIAGVFLLYVGLAFGSMLIVPLVVQFMATFIDSDIVRLGFTLRDYIDRIFQIVLGFGAAFQLPLVLFALMRLGIVSPDTLARHRGYIIIGLVVLAAFLTPPDVISQVLLAGPLWLLFELSLLFARLLPPSSEKPTD